MTFRQELIAGTRRMVDIHKEIARWHNAPSSASIAHMSLHEYLGFTFEEYALWVKDPNRLLLQLLAERDHPSPRSE